MKRALSAIVIAASVACTNDNREATPSDPATALFVAESDILRVRSLHGALELTNLSIDSVYFFAAEAKEWPLILPPLCQPTTCVGVPPRASLAVGKERIAGYVPGGVARVLHYRLIPRSSVPDFWPDSARTLSVRLR